MDKLHFPTRTEFDTALRQRVEKYMKDHNLKQTGTLGLHIKAVALVTFIVSCYFLLLFKCDNMLSAFLITFFLMQGKILLAFNVMHDGGHYSFSSKKWVNDLAAKSLELLGSSSMLWRQKHNSLHHTYTNVNGKDDDLDIGNLMRLCPAQEKKWWHRFQHFYAPVLYGFLSLYLLFYSDFQKMISKKISKGTDNRYDSKDLVIFIVSKIFYITYTLLIPMLLHPPLAVIALFLFAHLIFGLTLSIVFQLAHTVKETTFPVPDQKGNMPFSWCEHQVSTTANFAMNNPIVTFYCGGLNFQIEHHLFHRISHVHYPRISEIVAQTCQEFNKPYHVNPSFFGALLSHFRFLKAMGQ